MMRAKPRTPPRLVLASTLIRICLAIIFVVVVRVSPTTSSAGRRAVVVVRLSIGCLAGIDPVGIDVDGLAERVDAALVGLAALATCQIAQVALAVHLDRDRICV